MKLIGMFCCGLWLAALGACSPPAYRAPAASELDTKYSPCLEIAKTCQEHDAQSSLAHDCNQLAKDGSDDECQARRNDCWDECHRAFRGAGAGPPH